MPKRTCSVDGCACEHYAKGFCSKHYQRWWRHGDPTVVAVAKRTRVYVSSPLAERFWAKVDKTGTCWVWTGSCRPNGYGQIKDRGRVVKAHRVSYEMAYGPIPAWLVVCHHCDNPPCVRPSHLFLGTQADNMLDMRSKGRNR